MSGILGPNVAGSWYPGDPDALGRLLDRLLRDTGAEPHSRGRIVGLVQPHAGYAYSGAVAASGFRGLQGMRPGRVLLLGPSHHHAIAGAAVPSATTYRTPLGDVGLDAAAATALGRHPAFVLGDGPFLREHSLEMEIPFLQRVLEGSWTLLPVLLGSRIGERDAAAIAEALRPWLGETDLVVASSDFTHYGRSFGYVPFKDRIEDNLRELDLGAVRAIEALDPVQFRDYVTRTGATICGRHAIEVVLHMLPEGTRPKLVQYDTSGRMTGDWAHTVSYASLAFLTGGGATG